MENMGPRKYHPGGPACCFNGKMIDYLTFSSKSGGITAEILVDILKYFDRKEIFPPIPHGPRSMHPCMKLGSLARVEVTNRSELTKQIKRLIHILEKINDQESQFKHMRK